MSNVKNKLVKLAYEAPHLRKELLPLITKLAVEAAGYEPHIEATIDSFEFEPFIEKKVSHWQEWSSKLRWHASGKVSFSLKKEGKELFNIAIPWSTTGKWWAGTPKDNHISDEHDAGQHAYPIKDYLKGNIVDWVEHGTGKYQPSDKITQLQMLIDRVESSLVKVVYMTARSAAFEHLKTSMSREEIKIIALDKPLQSNLRDTLLTDITDGLKEKFTPALNKVTPTLKEVHEKHLKGLNPYLERRGR